MSQTQLDQVIDQADLPPVEEIEFGELKSISLSAKTTSLTHGLHRYPAKYIPQIPRWAIRNFSQPGDLVLDPFCGSGTSILEAIAAGRDCVGIDLDHIACLIAKAKISPPSSTRLREIKRQIEQREFPSLPVAPLPLAGIENPDHWFTPEARSDLLGLQSAIQEFCLDEREADFLNSVFSSIIRSVSNADDQSQKTYVSGTLPKTPPAVPNTFINRLNRAIEGVEELESVQAIGEGVVRCRSAEDTGIAAQSVDLIVTSPPYLDSVDYVYNFMLEYFWLGPRFGIKSRKDLNVRKRQYIGSKNPNAPTKLPEALRADFDLSEFPEYRQKAIAPYFALMKNHFVEAARVLKNGGRYVLVIGNSRTRKGVLPLHDAMVALASEVGLKLEHAFGYRIRRHYMKFPRKGRGGIILMDWVITFQKSADAATYQGRLPLVDEQLPPDAVAN